MGKKSSPPPPDYSAVQKQSAEAQRVANELGRAQLDENKRQYDDTKAITAPIIEKQAALLDQTKSQGDEYFKNWQSGQAVTTALKDQVLTDNTQRDADSRAAILKSIEDQAKGYEGLAAGQNAFGDKQAAEITAAQNQIADQQSQEVGAAADRIGVAVDKYGKPVTDAIDLYTAGNSAIRDKYGDDIEQDVGRAVSDARAGQAQSSNQAIRQALRYGLNPNDVAGQNTLGQAQLLAATANGSRNDSTDKYRGLVGNSVAMRQAILNTGVQAAESDAGIRASGAQSAAGLRSTGALQAIQSKQSANSQALGLNAGAIDKRATAAMTDRDLRRQDEATGLAQKLDVAGLYNGQIGASQGAYSLANQSGNSAASNQTSTAGQYLSGMNAGTNTILNGQQLALGGLGNVLSAQTSAYNTGQQNKGSFLGTVAGLVTAGAKAYTAVGSERAYKTNIEQVGNLSSGLPIYSFEYLPKYAAKWGTGKHVGVMADELIKIMPKAISKDIDGDTVVDYSMLKGVDNG